MEVQLACEAVRRPLTRLPQGWTNLRWRRSFQLRYYRNLLAILFAIKEINQNQHLLPNHTLGFQILDSCLSEVVALQDTLQLLSEGVFPNYKCEAYLTVVGIVGEVYSSVCEVMARILGIYKIPQVPRSVCSESCPVGYRKSARKGRPSCCFDCIPCATGEIANETDITVCWKCPEDQWPNESRDKCIPKVVEFLSYQEPLGAALAAVAVILSLVTVLILSIFFWFQNTSMVKANNRGLSYLLLCTLVLCFLCSLTFVGLPMELTCMIRQPAFGLIFTVSVSCILAKTVTVVIAFKAVSPRNHLRKWVGSKIPNLIVVLCSFIQLIICNYWISSHPPFPENNTKSESGKIIIECNNGLSILFYCMLGYLGFMAIISFIVAFLARTLPDSFNEAKFITFSMLVFVSVWLSFIPAYLSTQGKYMVAVEIFAILSSGAGLLFLIYLPKCYIILL